MPQKFVIKDVQLAKALDIDNQKLHDIEIFFDSDDDDEWELTQGLDYLLQAGHRIYSYEGAYAIAEYLHSKEKPNIIQRLTEWITNFKKNLRQSLVKQKIVDVIDSPGKLVKINNCHFVAKKDIVHILGTNHARINRAFDEIKRTDKPLLADKEYIDIDGERYYSMKGFFRISRHLGDKLTKKNRRDWCEDIEEVGDKTVNRIIKTWSNWQKDIDNAKNYVRNNRDNKTCKVCGKKASNKKLTGVIQLAVHHLYSQAYYPQIAASPDNLITLTINIHDEFHSWMGGTKKKCTIEDFIHFLNERYPESDDVKIWLNQKKMILGNPKTTTIKSKELLLSQSI